MSTETIIAMALVKYGPVLAKALLDILTAKEPTTAQWDSVFALAEKSYDDYVKG
jgi:hypothetical protein